MEKLGEGLTFKYEPIFEQAPTDMKFHYYETLEDGTQVLRIREENFKLITDIEELASYIEKCKGKIIGFDTETTGLSYGKDKIVGFSISLDEYSGFYVPIRHQNRVGTSVRMDRLDENGNQILTKSGKPSKTTVTTYEYFDLEENLDPKEALDTLYEILKSAKLVLIHNAEFDLNMLKFEGYDIANIRSFDTLILPYLYDPEATNLAGLKALEKRVLGRSVPEFKDVLGKDAENFAFVKPKDGYVYACCDTSGLVGIFKRMYPEVRELLSRFKDKLSFDGEVYEVLQKDNQLVQAFVDYYGHAKILIDKEKAAVYRDQLIERRKEVMRKIYEYFDVGPFNLSTSSNEFKNVMASKNVYTGVKTDKGGHSWGKPAAAEMKRNLTKVREALQKWREVPYLNGELSKKGALAAGFAAALELYGGYYFHKIESKLDKLKFKGPDKKPMPFVEFWRTVQFMYKSEMKKLEILGLIHENNSANKALNSYVDKLTKVDECFMKYRLKGTKSGRLSSGNGSKSDKRRNSYYIDLNAQNLTKPASAYYSAEQVDPSDPEAILGWKFTPLDKDYALSHLEDLYIVEGQDPGITIRGCLKAPAGREQFSYVPDDNGSEIKEVIEVEMDNGKVLKCSIDTVFKVKEGSSISFLPLESIIKLNNVEILED